MDQECPHLKLSMNDFVCMASVTSMRLSMIELTSYCKTEEYDCCPILLARTLRASS